MSDEQGWQPHEPKRGTISVPVDVGIVKATLEGDGKERLLLAMTFDGDGGERDVLIGLENALKFSRLIAHRLAEFGDPTAQAVMRSYEQHWGPRPPREE